MVAATADIVIVTDEIDRLAIDIDRAAVRMLDNLEKALEVTARGIKESAAKSVRSTFGHIPALPYSIDYDVEWYRGGLRAEIGYNPDKPQGNMGHIIEFGSSTGYDAPNAPQRNLAKGLAEWREDALNGLRKAVLDGFDQ